MGTSLQDEEEREVSGTQQVGRSGGRIFLGPGEGGSVSRFVFPSRPEENPDQTAHAGVACA